MCQKQKKIKFASFAIAEVCNINIQRLVAFILLQDSNAYFVPQLDFANLNIFKLLLVQVVQISVK